MLECTGGRHWDPERERLTYKPSLLITSWGRWSQGGFPEGQRITASRPHTNHCQPPIQITATHQSNTHTALRYVDTGMAIKSDPEKAMMVDPTPGNWARRRLLGWGWDGGRVGREGGGERGQEGRERGKEEERVGLL